MSTSFQLNGRPVTVDADPSTPIEPLLRELLMPRAEPLEDLWQKGPLHSRRLGDVLLI